MAGSYIPLYRKYRPQVFSEVVGQEMVVKALSNAITIDKVSHAYLLTGPRGTGKTSMARIFAKSLNCEKGSTLTPCGKCASCLDITAGKAIDVIEIDAASNRGVDDARELLEKVQFAPVAGQYKIYIIDEVHMLTKEAFNTLLKTIEEPPKNLVFILATTEAHKVLDTIISRCQRFDFRRITQVDILNRLKEINKLEKLNISDTALSVISRKAAGGLRDALALLDQSSVLSAINEEVTDEDVLTLLGSLSEEVLFAITQTILEKDTTKLIKLLDDVVQKGNEPSVVIRELIEHFRNLMLAKTAKNYEDIEKLTNVSEHLYKDIKSQSDNFEMLEITQIIEKLSECERTLKTTSQQYLWLELGLISVCCRNDIQVIKDLEHRIETLEKAISSGKIEMPSVEYSVAKTKPAPVVKVEQQVPAAVIAQKAPVQEPIVRKITVQDTEVEKPIVQKSKAEEVVIDNQEVEVDVIEEVTEKTNVVETIPVAQKVEAPVVNSPSREDLSASWSTLLGFIPSVPSRMFFMNLSKPIIVTESRVEIAFKSDGFVKQAQDGNKLTPLEEACKAMFGAVPKIIIRVLTPDDKKKLADFKPPKKVEPAKTTSSVSKPEMSKQPNAIARKTEVCSSEVDVQIKQSLSQSPFSKSTFSDTAKTALDIFQAKVIE